MGDPARRAIFGWAISLTRPFIRVCATGTADVPISCELYLVEPSLTAIFLNCDLQGGPETAGYASAGSFCVEPLLPGAEESHREVYYDYASADE